MLILPDHPLFNFYLQTAKPPDFNHRQDISDTPINFVLDAHTGILRTANEQELNDYLFGGEYDEVIDEYDEDFLEDELDC